MMKFADRRVAGWKNRHLDQMAVMDRLAARTRNGFTLTSDERGFWNDTVSLFTRYNPEKRCPYGMI